MPSDVVVQKVAEYELAPSLSSVLREKFTAGSDYCAMMDIDAHSLPPNPGVEALHSFLSQWVRAMKTRVQPGKMITPSRAQQLGWDLMEYTSEFDEARAVIDKLLKRLS